MDVLASYSFASAGWQITQAFPLIFWPQSIIGLLHFDDPYVAGPGGVSNGLDIYFARSFGLALSTLGLVSLVLSGSLPLGSSTDGTFRPPRTLETSSSEVLGHANFSVLVAPEALAPYSSAILLLTTLHHGMTAFYCWACYSADGSGHQTGYLIGSVVSSILASWGLWCSMFGEGKGRVSKRTGADKRTSGWPFKNNEADRRKGK